MSIQAQNTELNIVPGGIIPVVHVSQYDVDRVLTFNLYDRNSEASLASGTTAVIEGTKPDGNGFQYAATISGNTVTVNTTIQMTVLSGTVDCKIVLRNGSQVIGTALFIMDVEKAGINENTPMSETDLPLIISEATEQMERAEAAATAAALSEENAEAEALKAEGYATGKQNGEEVSSESLYYHNNAEYYSEYAESIADRLPEGLSPKGTCVFADLPSISESIVGDMWVISDSFITTSDFRGGSGVSVPSGAYVYLTDSNKWDILPSKSGGHTILDSDGVTMPQRSKLKFVGCTVTDDSTNDTTIVEAEGGGGGTIVAVPAVTNTSITYDGTEKSPTITRDTDHTYIQGDYEATNYGTYTFTIGLSGVNDVWSDNTTEPKSYTWSINYDGGTITPVNDIQTWLKCANIDDKAYTTLSEVLADHETLYALINNNNAIDYLVRSTSWVSGITADETAMEYIGHKNYASNTLLDDSTWCTAICNSAYFESVLNTKVPTMTSTNTPEGEAIESSETDINNTAYLAFDRDTSTGWQSGASEINNYVGYKFDKKTSVKIVEITASDVTISGSPITTSFLIQGSNDKINWTTLYTTPQITPSSGLSEYKYTFNNENEYLYYRIFTEDVLVVYAQRSMRILELQFYGRTDITENQIDIYSAASDTVYYMDNGSPVTVCTTDTTGHGTVAKSSLPTGTYTIYSTVNQTSKAVVITDSTLEIDLT